MVSNDSVLIKGYDKNNKCIVKYIDYNLNSPCFASLFKEIEKTKTALSHHKNFKYLSHREMVNKREMFIKFKDVEYFTYDINIYIVGRYLKNIYDFYSYDKCGFKTKEIRQFLDEIENVTDIKINLTEVKRDKLPRNLKRQAIPKRKNYIISFKLDTRLHDGCIHRFIPLCTRWIWEGEKRRNILKQCLNKYNTSELNPFNLSFMSIFQLYHKYAHSKLGITSHVVFENRFIPMNDGMLKVYLRSNNRKSYYYVNTNIPSTYSGYYDIYSNFIANDIIKMNRSLKSLIKELVENGKQIKNICSWRR